MKKIIITGGLGYIGSELCKIYSGYSWNDKVIVIDNRFISERVNQLRKWNMEFIHGDILDKELIKKYCHDADIVHHLAGITDVPRVKSEASIESSTGNSINVPVCALGGSISTPSKGIRAQVIEVKSFEELKNYGKNKVQGKIGFFISFFGVTETQKLIREKIK